MSNIHTFAPGQTQPAPLEASKLPTLAELVASNRRVASYAAAQDQARNLPDLPKPHALVAGSAQNWREKALGQRRQLLSTQDAENAAGAVRAAFSGPQHAPVVLLLLAQLLDCYSSDKVGNPKTFLEALAFDLSEAGYSTATIAAACLDLRRTSKFKPSIAEVLERCRAKHQFAKGVHAGHWRYTERLKAVHTLLHHTGGDPDPAEATAYAPVPDEPLLVAAYLEGPGSRWWYDLDLNTDLAFRQTAEGEESPEEWRARYLQMKAEAVADPVGLRLRIERGWGAQVGRRLAWAYHQRLGVDRRRDACAEIERLSLGRHPNRQPADLHEAWIGGADAAFTQRWDELEPNYDADERRRQERDNRERAEREAHLRRYRNTGAR